jgi:hypothetical protein
MFANDLPLKSNNHTIRLLEMTVISTKLSVIKS